MRKHGKLFSVLAILLIIAITPVYAHNHHRGNKMQSAQVAYNGMQGRNYTAYTQAVATEYSPIDTEELISARAAYLSFLVAEGIITQEEAESALQNYRDMLEYNVNNGAYGYGYGNGYGNGYCNGYGYASGYCYDNGYCGGYGRGSCGIYFGY